jgi:hypothetical protein
MADRLSKTRGAVGCAHCQSLDATGSCDICGRPICVTCAVDTLSTCPEPAALSLSMGSGRRLLSVDEHGHLALVFGLRAGLLDLQQRRWVECNPALHLLTMGPWPVLAGDLMISARVRSTKFEHCGSSSPSAGQPEPRWAVAGRRA